MPKLNIFQLQKSLKIDRKTVIVDKKSLEVGSFNKFIGILNNNFFTQDLKYKSIVKE